MPLSLLLGRNFIPVVALAMSVDEVGSEVVVALLVEVVAFVVVFVVVEAVVVTVFLVVLVRGSTEQSVIFRLSNASFESPFV